MIPDAISVASENSVSTLTTTYDLPQFLILTSDDPNPLRSMKKYDIYHGKIKIEYYSRKRDEKDGGKRGLLIHVI